MTREWFLDSAITLAVLAGVVALLQVIWVLWRDTQARRARVLARMGSGYGAVAGEEAPQRLMVTDTRLQRVMLRGDISVSESAFRGLLFLLLAVLVLVVLVWGVIAAVLCLATVGVGLWVYWFRRYSARRLQINETLPGIADAIIRGLSAGRTLDNAVMKALDEAPEIYAPLAFRVRSAIEGGRDYVPLFEDFADLYQIPPLVQMAIGLGTGQRHGASVQSVLAQLAESLRGQQQLRRDFMAMTGETRVSAVLFAVVPIALAAYLMLANEEYLQVLLHTPQGNRMLMVAAAFEAVGIFWLYRMVQGVGRV
ncbi:MAG: type II secretion protein F [Alcanivorax sp.]|nr:type II secretion protein F [Alcanivorax sp.]